MKSANRISTIEYIKSDLFRYTGNLSVKSFLVQIIRNKAFRVTTAIRLYQSPNILVHYFGLIIYEIARNDSLQIPRNLKIGYGLYIGHNGPVIINPTAKIGNNVNLSQFTTIGSNRGKAATIGDNVYIGPNVCIIENVTIGNNSTIGAGSIVTKDIPENATAVGNYCKVINYNFPCRFIQNRYVPNTIIDTRQTK